LLLTTHGVFGAGQFRQPALDVLIAFAASGAVEIEIRRLTGRVIACTTASAAQRGITARPRLVWSTVPLRLKTGLKDGRVSSIS
jgi:hypothetical protein